MRKYEYTGKTTKVDGKTYREIVAIRDFGNIRAGEVGAGRELHPFPAGNRRPHRGRPHRKAAAEAARRGLC